VKTELSERGSLERMDLVHIAIGGAICLGITELLSDLIWYELPQFLFNLGILGFVFFIEYYQIAGGLLFFGLACLTSGFCGGIYTGYNVYVDLKRILLIPAAISTVGRLLLAMIFSAYSLTPEFIGLMLLQLAGNTLGSYLGGYAINWRLLHEESRAPEKLTLETPKQPTKSQKR
jgi:hypothetical protein